MNFVLDIETIPRDLRTEPRKIQEYVWERVVRRAEGDGVPSLDEFLGNMERAAFADVRRDLERYMALRPEFGHVVCIGMGHDGRGRGELETKALTARAVEDERAILEAFWDVVRNGRRVPAVVTVAAIVNVALPPDARLPTVHVPVALL